MLKKLTIACALFASPPSFAAAGNVAMSGCVSGGLEGCLFLKSARGTYSLYVGNPRPSPGRGINVIGTFDNGPNACMIGTGIRVLRWSYNRLRCPK